MKKLFAGIGVFLAVVIGFGLMAGSGILGTPHQCVASHYETKPVYYYYEMNPDARVWIRDEQTFVCDKWVNPYEHAR